MYVQLFGFANFFSHMACQSTSYAERLRVAAYLNSVAYRFDPNKPPRLDRTAFAARKHAE